ncbi:hypothetical protein D3C72_1311110 [compost metagenome]
MFHQMERIYTIIFKNAMQHGNVTSTGTNAGGLIGYLYAYNPTNSNYTHYNYSKIENSFATRRSNRCGKCRRISWIYI